MKPENPKGPLGQDLTPSELVTRLAHEEDVRQTTKLLTEAIQTRLPWRNATVSSWYDPTAFAYRVRVEVLGAGNDETQVFRLERFITDEVMWTHTESTQSWRRYLDQEANQIFQYLQASMDRAGFTYCRPQSATRTMLLDGITASSSSITYNSTLNFNVDSTRLTQAMYTMSNSITASEKSFNETREAMKKLDEMVSEKAKAKAQLAKLEAKLDETATNEAIESIKRRVSLD